MKYKVTDFLECLKKECIEYRFFGKQELEIDTFCALNNPKEHAITWIKKPEKFDCTQLEGYNGKILIVTTFEAETQFRNTNHIMILCSNPKEVFFLILTEFFQMENYEPGIHSTAVVETSDYGKILHVGANTYIGKNVTIGDHVVIKNNCSIEGKVNIGDNTIIHSGVIIGTDGYGYYKDSNGINKKVPHFGGVIIGKDVEIGANTCIDRGTLENTVIGENVKIDNLCHIGHNVIIEKNSMVIAQAMLGGSSHLLKDSYIAPCASVMNQISIGENALIGMGAVVTKNVADGSIMAGVPAKKIRDNT